MLKRVNIILTVIVMLLAVLIVPCFVLYLYVTLQGTNDRNSGHEYKISTYDSTGKVAHGVVTLNEELKESEYVSYVNSNDQYNLISRLGDKEYTCSGECVCYEDYNGRRNALTQVLATGILVALGYNGWSTYKLRKELKQQGEEKVTEYCEERYVNECPSGRVEGKGVVCDFENEGKTENGGDWTCKGKCGVFVSGDREFDEEFENFEKEMQEFEKNFNGRTVRKHLKKGDIDKMIRDEFGDGFLGFRGSFLNNWFRNDLRDFCENRSFDKRFQKFLDKFEDCPWCEHEGHCHPESESNEKEETEDY